MWMMGYNDVHSGELNLHDSSFSGTTRRLRPLIPRPLPSSSSNSPSNPPFFAQYQQHLGNYLGEQSKRETSNGNGIGGGAPQVVVSSRWNPTPEQLRALEELYRRGTRTPSAEQIQQITAQLRRYGKIEGKNVFYWFQNHKARERQKRRRQMESTTTGDDLHKELGSSRTVFEAEQIKIWPPSSTCTTTTLSQDPHVSIQRAVSENNNNNNNKVTAGAESSAMQMRTDGSIRLGELELQNRWNINSMNGFAERNATWQKMQLSCPSPHLLTHLINTPTSTTTSTITTTATTTNIDINNNINNRNKNVTNTPKARDPSFLTKSSAITQQDYLSILMTQGYNIPSHHIQHQNNGLVNNSCDSSQIIEDDDGDGDDDEYDDYAHNYICPSSQESQTLQLFPLRSGGDFINDKEAISGPNAPTQLQFFEFLPLKN